VNLIVRLQNIYGPLPYGYFAHWDQLDPHQTADALLGDEPILSYLDDMKAQGFSQSEAESFVGLWERVFYMTSWTDDFSNLIYRLPQSEYDKLISLSVTPTPDKIVRTLYILTHLRRPTPDMAVVGKVFGSWEWVQSSGGIAGRIITPETEGYTKTAHFRNDWTYKEERNDTTFLETTYQAYKDTVGNSTFNMLQINGWEPMAIINVTDSTLELMDECIDCYLHSYRRLMPQ
jgi:hypothetical protein